MAKRKISSKETEVKNDIRSGIKNKKFLIGSAVVLGLAIIAAYFTFASGLNCSVMRAGTTKTVCTAQAYVGVKESPANSNHGSSVDEFNRKGGGNLGDEWCASFLSYVLRKGRGSTSVKTSSTAEMVNQFQRNGHRVLPYSKANLAIGDIVYRHRGAPDGGTGHVAMIVGWQRDGSGFTTVEGNTKCAKENNGCVRYRFYNFNGRPQDADNKTANSWEKVLKW
jgi:hypothetical protein